MLSVLLGPSLLSPAVGGSRPPTQRESPAATSCDPESSARPDHLLHSLCLPRNRRRQVLAPAPGHQHITLNPPPDPLPRQTPPRPDRDPHPRLQLPIRHRIVDLDPKLMPDPVHERVGVSRLFDPPPPRLIHL